MSESLEKDKKNVDTKKTIDDSILEKLATEELLREACRGAIRAEVVGPSGWLKSQQLKTNKTFLKNTLKNALSSNNYRFNKRNEKNSKDLRRDVSEKYKKTKETRSVPYRKK